MAGIADIPTKIQLACCMFSNAGVLTAKAAINVPKMI